MYKPYLKRTFQLLAFGDTALVRFWFACAGYCWATLIFLSTTFDVRLLDFQTANSVWVVLYLIHATALMYGVMTGRFCTLLLLMEGVLGIALWGSSAVSFWLHTGHPDPTLAGALVSLHLLIRYPHGNPEDYDRDYNQCDCGVKDDKHKL